MNVVEAMELLKGRLKKVKTNAEFLMTMAFWLSWYTGPAGRVLVARGFIARRFRG